MIIFEIIYFQCCLYVREVYYCAATFYFLLHTFSDLEEQTLCTSLCLLAKLLVDGLGADVACLLHWALHTCLPSLCLLYLLFVKFDLMSWVA